MTFEDEWAGLRADAVARTRLNGAGGTGGGPDLSSSAAKKRSAVTALEQHIEPDSQAAGRVADETSEAAARGFKDWATGAGINEALKGWRESVKALQTRLSAEKAALSGTNRLFLGADSGIAGQFPLLKPGGSGPLNANPPFPSRVSGY
ncbi:MULTISPECIES: hypothetical protein [Streptomyces]|uniref:WXG100 family type VII secretion target n=2 Tax=Streptomyces TaxID=1883 RepID=A0A3Q9FWS0_STRLT|nr:hypothetical protein [Streptomyces luteoverticillatus]AZQ73860.1 hypothetical protein EKH77_23935 [Streptomyces luteoverticillatus]